MIKSNDWQAMLGIPQALSLGVIIVLAIELYDRPALVAAPYTPTVQVFHGNLHGRGQGLTIQVQTAHDVTPTAIRLVCIRTGQVVRVDPVASVVLADGTVHVATVLGTDWPVGTVGETVRVEILQGNSWRRIDTVRIRRR